MRKLFLFFVFISSCVFSQDANCITKKESKFVYDEFWRNFPDVSSMKEFVKDGVYVDGMPKLFYVEKYSEDINGVVDFLKKYRTEMVLAKKSSAIVSYRYQSDSGLELSVENKFPDGYCVVVMDFFSDFYKKACPDEVPNVAGYWFSFEKSQDNEINLVSIQGGDGVKTCNKSGRMVGNGHRMLNR